MRSAPTGVVLAFRDVTEQRRAEAAIQRHAQKLESLGLLAGGIAHDFNNLLAPILGNAELLKHRFGGDPEAVQMIEAIETATRNAAQLTLQMLAYAGKGRFVIEPLDLSLLVGEMTALLLASASKKVDLQYELARKLTCHRGRRCPDQASGHEPDHQRLEACGESDGVIHVHTRLVRPTPTSSPRPSSHRRQTPGSSSFDGVRQRLRHVGGDAAVHLRPVLHHEVHRSGAGPGGGAGYRPGSPGDTQGAQAPGQGTTFEVYFPRSIREPVANHPVSLRGGSTKGTVLVVDDEDAGQETG